MKMRWLLALFCLLLALCQAQGDDVAPITDIQVTTAYFESSAKCKKGYDRIKQDLNSGTVVGKAVFLCISRDPTKGAPITGIEVLTSLTGDDKDMQNQCPPTFTRIKQDLNVGTTVGYYVFLCYTRDDNGGAGKGIQQITFSRVKQTAGDGPDASDLDDDEKNDDNSGKKTNNKYTVTGNLDRDVETVHEMLDEFFMPLSMSNPLRELVRASNEEHNRNKRQPSILDTMLSPFRGRFGNSESNSNSQVHTNANNGMLGIHKHCPDTYYQIPGDINRGTPATAIYMCVYKDGLQITPRHVHLSFAGQDDTERTPEQARADDDAKVANGENPSPLVAINVGWMTMMPYILPYKPLVLYGTAPGNYTMTSASSGSKPRSQRYAISFHHDVTIRGLAPSTRYYYKTGDSVYGYSREFSFVSPPHDTSSNFNVMRYGAPSSAPPTPSASSSSSPAAYVPFAQRYSHLETILQRAANHTSGPDASSNQTANTNANTNTNTQHGHTPNTRNARGPLAAGEAEWKMLLVGDLGTQHADQTMAAMKSYIGKVDFFYHIGDISYADDYALQKLHNPLYESVYNYWGDMMEETLASAPYMVLPGNHEAACHTYTNVGCSAARTNFTVYRTRWSMPYESSKGVNNMWYSFNYKNMHIVSIDTETDYDGAPCTYGNIIGNQAGPFGDQLAWLKADLAKANTPENRAVRPWLIVVGHRPMYGNSATDFPPGVQAATRKAFEDLWKDYDVDMYITGHIHAYQRFWPVYNDKKMGSDYINPKATVHVANGAAGNEESHDTKFPPTMNYTNVLDYQHFGYALLDVVSDTTLTYTFIASSDDTILDQFTVVKDPLPPVSGDDDGGNDGGGNDNDDGESIPVGPEEPASENEEEEADGGEGEDWTDIQILVE